MPDEECPHLMPFWVISQDDQGVVTVTCSQCGAPVDLDDEDEDA